MHILLRFWCIWCICCDFVVILRYCCDLAWYCCDVVAILLQLAILNRKLWFRHRSAILYHLRFGIAAIGLYWDQGQGCRSSSSHRASGALWVAHQELLEIAEGCQRTGVITSASVSSPKQNVSTFFSWGGSAPDPPLSRPGGLRDSPIYSIRYNKYIKCTFCCDFDAFDAFVAILLWFCDIVAI